MSWWNPPTFYSFFCFCIWIKGFAAAFVETAEHLVIFQTQYLDADDQSFKSAHEQVPEDHARSSSGGPLSAPAKHQDHFHDGRVADSESADTDKGDGVGKVAQQSLEQFKKSLYTGTSPFLLPSCPPVSG